MDIKPVRDATRQTAPKRSQNPEGETFSKEIMAELLNRQQGVDVNNSLMHGAIAPGSRLAYLRPEDLANRGYGAIAVFDGDDDSEYPAGEDPRSAAETVMNLIGSDGTIDLADVQNLFGFDDHAEAARALIADDWDRLTGGTGIMTVDQLSDAIGHLERKRDD